MNWINFWKLTGVLVLVSIALTIIHELLGVPQGARVVVNPIVGAIVGFFSYFRWPILKD